MDHLYSFKVSLLFSFLLIWNLPLPVHSCQPSSPSTARTCLTPIEEQLRELGQVQLLYCSTSKQPSKHSSKTVCSAWRSPSHECQEIGETLTSGELLAVPPSVVCYIYSRCHCKGVRNALYSGGSKSFEVSDNNPVKSYRCYPKMLDIDVIKC